MNLLSKLLLVKSVRFSKKLFKFNQFQNPSANIGYIPFCASGYIRITTKQKSSSFDYSDSKRVCIQKIIYAAQNNFERAIHTHEEKAFGIIVPNFQEDEQRVENKQFIDPSILEMKTGRTMPYI